MNYFALCIVTSLISIAAVSGKTIPLPKAAFDKPHVFLTVHAPASVNSDGSLTSRKLELRWQNFEVSSSDWIGLFDYDPTTLDESVDQGPLALEKYSVTTGNGEQLTSVRLPVMDLRQYAEMEELCLGFWIGYFSEGSNLPRNSNCIRRNPKWMNDLKEVIGDVPLNSLMIPGTHDAGAWKVYEGSESDENPFTKYTYTHEEDIYNQLAYGNRYLDVRVAYYKNTPEQFWVNHGVVQIRPLITLFHDVMNYTRDTNEIVSMDFHRFPVGFDSIEIHRQLYDFVKGFFGDNILAPDSFGQAVTANMMWNAGKSVILTYGDSFHSEHSEYWPSLYQAWGDVNTPEDLETYLASAVQQNGCQNKFWSAMAEQTPTAGDIIGTPNKGLRGFAQEINGPLTQWFRREGWYSNAHVIATDYFLGTNLIEMSIEVNRHRLTCPI